MNNKEKIKMLMRISAERGSRLIDLENEIKDYFSNHSLSIKPEKSFELNEHSVNLHCLN